MKKDKRTYRFLILGAGFSRAAGLPLAGELLKRVRKIFELTSLDNIVEHDLERYVQFKKMWI
jgi:hypothetical protein